MFRKHQNFSSLLNLLNSPYSKGSPSSCGQWKTVSDTTVMVQHFFLLSKFSAYIMCVV